MKKLERIKEVSVTDEFFAVYDLLGALGYKTEGLTILDISFVKWDVLKLLENIELKETELVK